MRSRTKHAVAAIGILALMAVGSYASAQPGPTREWQGDRPQRLERMAARLGLSDEQKARLEKIHEDALSEQVGFHKELLRIRHEIKGEMLKDEPDMNTLKKLIGKKGEILVKIETARLERRMAVRKILTPEQRDRFFLFGGFHGRGNRCEFGPIGDRTHRGRMERGCGGRGHGGQYGGHGGPMGGWDDSPGGAW